MENEAAMSRSAKTLIVKAIVVVCMATLIGLGGNYLNAMQTRGGFDAIIRDSPAPELRVAEERILLEPSEGSFSFAVLGDMRWESPPRIAVLKDAQQRKPLFMTNLGDAVAKSRGAEWEKYLDELAANWDRSIPYFHIPGGHSRNYRFDGVYPAFFQHYFGRTNYYVDVKGWRFCFLDTSSGNIPNDQESWLKERLREAERDRRKVVLFMHHPPRLEAQGIKHALSGADTQKLAQIIKGGEIAAIFCGHIHSTFKYTWDGIPVYVTSLDGSSWKEQPAEYLHVVVQENQLIVTRTSLTRDMARSVEQL
jgi:3',5'-cyclic AMP phosphodiesterase CpdA